jgi:hypothetical protein
MHKQQETILNIYSSNQEGKMSTYLTETEKNLTLIMEQRRRAVMAGMQIRHHSLYSIQQIVQLDHIFM